MDSSKKLIKNKNKSPISSDIGTSSEDDLLVSSQETIKPGSSGSTRHSTPELSDNKKTKATSHSGQKHKKRKSSGQVEKRRYQKAVFILNKIARNEAAGTIHERDQEDKRKYQAVVDEFNKRQEARKAEVKPATKAKKPAPKLSLALSEVAKRNRSQDEEGSAPKRAKVEIKPSTSQARRTMSEVVRDHLQVALVDEASNGKLSTEAWSKIEAKLSEMVMDHLLGSEGGPIPGFDSSETLRGYRVIKCEDQFSKDFLSASVAKISDAWEGLKLKLIPAKEIPKRPRARIWLPNMKLDGEKLLRCLKLQNPGVPMDDWAVIKAEEPQKHSLSFLLLINEECLPVLEKKDYKLRFGVRHAKLKIFETASPEDDQDLVGGASSQLLDMVIEEKKNLETDAEGSTD